MQSKVLCVFYGNDRLPYKDASRTTHYPIVGGDIFNGANNVTTIRFYVDLIGGVDNVTWCVVSKLPNGQIANEILNSENAILDDDLGEHYLEFSLSSYYTTLKGDLYLSLNGYQGGVEVEQDSDTGIYEIYGTPTIQATGSIKIGINYAPQTIQGTHFNTSDLQQILGLMSSKANISNVIFVIDDTSDLDIGTYDEGQIFFEKTTNAYYILEDGGFVKFLPNDYYDASSIPTIGDLYSLIGNRKCLAKLSNGNIYWVEMTYNFPTYDFVFRQLASGIGYKGEGVNSLTLIPTIFALTTYRTDFVDTTSDQTIGGNKTFEDDVTHSSPIYLDKTRVITNDKDYFARVRVSSNNTNYNLPYDYGNLGSVKTFKLAIQDDIPWKVSIYSVSGSTTLAQLIANVGMNGVFDYVNARYLFQYRSAGGGLYSFRLTIIGNTGSGLQLQNIDNYYIAYGSGNYVADTITLSEMLNSSYLQKPANQDWVNTQITNAMTSALVYKGSLTVAQINALDTSTLKVGDFYNISDSGIITLGNIEVVAGDNVAWTGSGWDKMTMDLSAYDDKFIAAGFFEVQDYNVNTGEITFVYASDLYTMSYDSNDGILTIEAN